MKQMLTGSILIFLFFFGACDDDSNGDSGSNSASCNAIPACYSAAVAALEMCVPKELTLNAIQVNSDVAQNASCTNGTVTIEFSDFGGSVPTPSTTTIVKDGNMCAKLQMAEGTRTANGGESVAFTGTIITIPDKDAVSIDAYENGVYEIECSHNTFKATSSELTNCPSDVAIVQMTKIGSVQQDNITQLGAQYVDIGGQSTSLFSCQ